MKILKTKPKKIYYTSDTSRAFFAIVGIIVVCALLYSVKVSFDKFEFRNEFKYYLIPFLGVLAAIHAYKGLKKLYVLIRFNIPIIELYDSFFIVALYQGGKYTFLYKSLFGKYSYSKINTKDIDSIYRNMKLIRMDYSKVHGYTFITGTIDGKKFDIPTIIGSIGSRNYLNLKIKLNQENFDVSKMI